MPYRKRLRQEENVLYLVKNAETQHYDIYALVDGVVELIDDTTVALDGYITEEELAQALEDLGAGTMYAGTKTDLTTADSDVISAFFGEEEAPTPKEGRCVHRHYPCWWGDL